jgi:hypothetical protein
MRLALAAVILAGVAALPMLAQAAPKNSCPGGFSACVERCTKAGGQTRLCPSYCRKQKGC